MINMRMKSDFYQVLSIYPFFCAVYLLFEIDTDVQIQPESLAVELSVVCVHSIITALGSIFSMKKKIIVGYCEFYPS